jgi:hypothetical protein
MKDDLGAPLFLLKLVRNLILTIVTAEPINTRVSPV